MEASKSAHGAVIQRSDKQWKRVCRRGRVAQKHVLLSPRLTVLARPHGCSTSVCFFARPVSPRRRRHSAVYEENGDYFNTNGRSARAHPEGPWDKRKNPQQEVRLPTYIAFFFNQGYRLTMPMRDLSSTATGCQM